MNVDLPQDAWQAILGLLAKQPYEVSAQLIHGISNQLREQVKPNGSGEALHSPMDTRPGA